LVFVCIVTASRVASIGEAQSRIPWEGISNRGPIVLRPPRSWCSQAIADQLHISIRTERNHVARILT